EQRDIGQQDHGGDAKADTDGRPHDLRQPEAHAGDLERDTRYDGTGSGAHDRGLQSRLLATGMIEAAPGNEGCPDCKHAAERPKEEPSGYGTQYAKANS